MIPRHKSGIGQIRFYIFSFRTLPQYWILWILKSALFGTLLQTFRTWEDHLMLSYEPSLPVFGEQIYFKIFIRLNLPHSLSYIMNPASSILHLASYIFHPASCILHPGSCIFYPANKKKATASSMPELCAIARLSRLVQK